MTRLFNLVSHPASIGLLGVVIALLFFPNPIVKYRLEVENVRRGGDIHKQYAYADLDHDGSIEGLMMSNYPTNGNVTVMNQQGAYMSTHNLPGYWYGAPEFFLGDADGNGKDEMYAFTLSRSDTLYLSRLSLSGDDHGRRDRVVCHFKRHKGELGQQVFCQGLLDVSGDGFPEVIFHVTAGFTLQPRHYYAWDMRADTLLKSAFAGTHYLTHRLYPRPVLNIGGRPLVFTSTSGTNNYRTPVPYSDSASYACVFTTGMNYLFEPVYCGGPQSRTWTGPFRYQGDDCILAITFHLRRGSHRNSIRVLDYAGRSLLVRDSIDLPNIKNSFRLMGNTYFLVQGNISTPLIRLNPDLSFEEVLSLDGNYSPSYIGNLDNDAGNELLVYDHGQEKLALIDEGLSHVTKADLPDLSEGIYKISLKELGKHSALFSVHSGGTNLEVSYARSPYYHIRWAYYILVYLLTTGTLMALQYLFVYRSRKKREMEEKVTNLQLQAVMNQLSPHFTFNAINSIGSAIVKGKKDEAYEYFTRLSDLIRMSMLNAFETHTTLEKELDFVRQYLIIEAYRAQGKLEWEVETDPEVDLSLTIPKMLIHLFVENAIKHGIFHLKDKGQVDVRVKQTGVGVLIMVRDNGVGFKKAFEIEKRKGKGLLILDNYLAILNRRQKHKISYKILDNSEPEHEDSGATILITIQL